MELQRLLIRSDLKAWALNWRVGSCTNLKRQWEIISTIFRLIFEMNVGFFGLTRADNLVA